ncbi:MAG: fasciclin domain-containing protein [Capsulimonadales bacterium]|nr:fasciclin domain-containing protein [Capsulimonadales bacterium]
MRNLIPTGRKAMLAAIVVLLAIPAFAEDIPTLAAKDPQFSTLVRLLQAADLTETLKQPGPFTVLAPTNEAFEKLPQTQRDDLLKPENRAMLRRVLLFHVTRGKMTAADVGRLAVGTRGPTLAGDELTVTSTEPLKINGAMVVRTDINADNGVIHVIDTVLMPTTPSPSGPAVTPTTGTVAPLPNATPLGTMTLTEVASADPQFSTLVTLLKAAGFDESLSKRGPLTVLAPTNEAFNKLPSGTVEDLMKPENLTTLQAILKYHLVPGQYVASDVSGLNGQAASTTLRGSTLAVSTTGGVRVNNATVVRPDVGARNGVIHVIDTVLMPPASALPQKPTMPEMMRNDRDRRDDAPRDPIKESTTQPTSPVP